MVENYIGGPARMASSYAMPGHADPSGLPPVAVLACEYDDLRSRPSSSRDRSARPAFPVAFRLEAGAMHGYLNHSAALGIVQRGLAFLADGSGLGEAISMIEIPRFRRALRPAVLGRSRIGSVHNGNGTWKRVESLMTAGRSPEGDRVFAPAATVPPLLLDLYLPGRRAPAAALRPAAVVHFHGGGWRMGERSSLGPVRTVLAQPLRTAG